MYLLANSFRFQFGSFYIYIIMNFFFLAFGVVYFSWSEGVRTHMMRWQRRRCCCRRDVSLYWVNVGTIIYVFCCVNVVAVIVVIGVECFVCRDFVACA